MPNKLGDIASIADRVAAAVKDNLAVLRVYLFGSRARGNADDYSDVDLRVVLDRSIPFGMFDLGNLYGSLRRSLGCEVDLITSDTLDAAFANAIERDKVLVYER